ncbi:4-(cytidine 5'-diphospho)-2-C-methyl-D-erythritol kinase [Desulfoscipio gibsoniae]|uniref:4-diphosphocytidyl-2-C-methyl-D-erythritol kinase n=1 Tax=Desulfoscipio gibsoniae DSM 7213 TaxID=767817 RepID=R4K979_9FIRM|nr:4-(cytidine 5'-diphospho)-2-C-methyl-D-erythritol kinase [Desulfoscipio gibsoniae]AGK99732.1 4-diphosphocytidyl-2C-methyl-D-erythritol kinase [Desulfoscipio gibsoniae DSM 7213]
MLVKAYAKINLLLDVLGTRPDGYHELVTVMQTLELHDTVVITKAREIELIVEGADLPCGRDNLAFRAADLLRRQVGYAGGASIKLIKRIPLAAGLAGGSADAAAVLCGLNSLWGLGMRMGKLLDLGAVIGSDVPFCLQGGTALVRGRGERVDPLPGLPSLGVVLAKPCFGVSTAEVYHRYDDIENPLHPDSQGMLQSVRGGDVSGLVACLGNALEQVTSSMHPEIEHIKSILAATGALGVLMSGSGPTVFGLFDNETAARQAAGRLKNGNFGVWVTNFYDPRS